MVIKKIGDDKVLAKLWFVLTWLLAFEGTFKFGAHITVKLWFIYTVTHSGIRQSNQICPQLKIHLYKSPIRPQHTYLIIFYKIGIYTLTYL